MNDYLRPDLESARLHLRLLTGGPDPIVAWQVVDDLKHRGDQTLARGFHGRFDEVLPRLREAQRAGCGIYVAVNATDGQRRRKENMRHARALFLDLDGVPLPATWPVEPDLIIHSSSHDGIDKYQCWWWLQPSDDFDRWQRMQMALAAAYGGDPKCTLTTQVGRCAGFFHLKRPDQPWQVRIVAENAVDETDRHQLEDLVAKFGFDLSAIAPLGADRASIERPPPTYGWDNPTDVALARALVAGEANWKRTSDGAVSIFKMACRLHDLGISQELAAELIEEHVLVLPPQADGDNRYIESKVGNAYRYAQNDPGADSREADRQMMADTLIDRNALALFLKKGDDNE